MIKPSKPTTPEQWTVLVWTAIGVFCLLGGVAFYCSFRVRPDDLVGIAKFRRLSFGFLGLAGFAWLARRVWLAWLG